MVRRYIRVPDGNVTPVGTPSRGRPIGVVVAEEKDGRINFGFSLCSHNDSFDKELGNAMAEGRLHSGKYFIPNDESVHAVDALKDAYPKSVDNNSASFHTTNGFSYYLDWITHEARRRSLPSK